MRQKGKKFCKYHGMCAHTTDERTTIKISIEQAILKRAKHNRHIYTKQEVNMLETKKIQKTLGRKKRNYTKVLYAFEKMNVSDLE